MRDFDRSFPMASNLQYARGVLVYDDMEGTNVWEISSSGAAGTGTFETVAAYAGTKGLVLKTRVAGAAPNDYCTGLRRTGLPESNFVCWRGRFATPGKAAAANFSWALQARVAATEWTFSMRYDVVNARVEYRAADGAWVPIGALACAIQNLAWISVEIVANVQRGEYVAVAFNGKRASLLGVPALVGGAAGAGSMLFGCSVYTVAAAAATMWVDGTYAGEWDGM